jgi:hypothetical protein
MIAEIKKKYENIEDKIPSVWPDYEKAAIEIAQDVATEWDIKDPEMIRVLALVDRRIAGMGKPSFNLSKHIYAPFAFAGLYPERMKTFNILPENISIGKALETVFLQEGFVYSSGGKVEGKTILQINSIINGTFTEDFMLFDNAGGRKFDVVTNLEEFPNRVRDFKDALLKENPSWVLAYRVDGKEIITPSFKNLLR